jgi:hypothetical protein
MNFNARAAAGAWVRLISMGEVSLPKFQSVSRVAFIVVLALLSGCGTSSNPAMTGTWLFVFTPTGSSTSAIQATANLTQVGTNVTGQVSLGVAASCGTEASMSGTVKGNSLTLQLTQIQSSINMTGTANQAFTSALGDYTAAAGSCLLNGGTGSWSAALQ